MMFNRNTKAMATYINTRPRWLGGTQEHNDREGKNLHVGGVTIRVF